MKYRYTFNQAAEFLGVTEIKLRMLVKEGTLAPEQKDHYLFTDETDLHRLRLTFLKPVLEEYLFNRARGVDKQDEILEELRFLYDEIRNIHGVLKSIQDKVNQREFLGVKDIAKLLGKSPQTIRNNIQDDRLEMKGISLPIFKIGGMNYFRISDLITVGIE